MNAKRRLKMLSESPVVTVEAVDLSSYDVICVSSSAGKDSQAMLDYVVELATMLGFLVAFGASMYWRTLEERWR